MIFEKVVTTNGFSHRFDSFPLIEVNHSLADVIVLELLRAFLASLCALIKLRHDGNFSIEQMRFKNSCMHSRSHLHRI